MPMRRMCFSIDRTNSWRRNGRGQHHSFFGQYGTVAYGELAAYSLLYSLPVIVLYVIVSRGIGGSFALQGAVKG